VKRFAVRQRADAVSAIDEFDQFVTAGGLHAAQFESSRYRDASYFSRDLSIRSVASEWTAETVPIRIHQVLFFWARLA
jgi:hypothetical protein